MNPKIGKNQQPLRPENAVIEGGIIYLPNDKRSWLEVTVEPDENTLRSQQRAITAEVFLQTRLIPLVEASNPPDEANIVDLLVNFKRARRDLDSEFEMAHVSARLLSRFQCYLLDDLNDSVALQSYSLDREMELFMSLAELDFQRIDEAVRDQLHSG